MRLCTVFLVLVLGESVWAQTEAKDETDGAKTTEDKVKAESLIDKAPIIVDINRRYYKFFGDPPETVGGGFLERSQLTGDWNGGRDQLADAGVYVDLGLTLNFMSNVSGGRDDSTSRGSGSMDLWLNLDTTKLTNALWPGAEIFLHGETRWNDGIMRAGGTAVPPVFDDTMPDATDDNGFYLSEYYVVQALSPELSVWIGQMDGAGLVDGNAFANSEKHQFMNTALVDNPAVGAFAPYTAFTAAAIYLPTPKNVLIAAVMDTQGDVERSVVDTYDTDATVFVGSYAWLPEFDGLPGRYQVLGGYSNKNIPDYQISSHLELAKDLLGTDTVADETDNYIGLVTLDQYLYVKDKEREVGWGLFGRYAITPKDRNAVDQFYSFGLGGRGCLIPGRDLDFWGLGWGATHISDDLRSDLGDLDLNIDSGFEHVIEGFYNIALTPAVHLTLDAQYVINPAIAQAEDSFGDVDSDDHVWFLGTRLQVDF
jgi:porin